MHARFMSLGRVGGGCHNCPHFPFSAAGSNGGRTLGVMRRAGWKRTARRLKLICARARAAIAPRCHNAQLHMTACQHQPDAEDFIFRNFLYARRTFKTSPEEPNSRNLMRHNKTNPYIVQSWFSRSYHSLLTKCAFLPSPTCSIHPL